MPQYYTKNPAASLRTVLGLEQMLNLFITNKDAYLSAIAK